MCSRDPGLWTLILSARGPAHPNSKVSFWIGADGSTPDWHSYRSPRQHLHYGVPLLLFAGSGARTRRAASFLASTPDAGAAHGGVDRCLVGAWPENLRARRTSFVDSARPEVAIKKVNDEALKSLKVIEEHAGPVDKYRQKLDEAMDSFTNATRSWCDYYMIHRQQIEAIAGRLCAAAQGRLNSSSLGDEKGPMYCYSEPADPAFPTQEVLQAAPCSRTSGHSTLQCAKRLKELENGDPPPGEPARTKSMDTWISEWCHPSIPVPAFSISKQKAVGRS